MYVCVYVSYFSEIILQLRGAKQKELKHQLQQDKLKCSAFQQS